MTGNALEALVRDEIRRARLRFQHEIRRNSVGLFLLLHSDWAWIEGVGGRLILGHDDVRRREASIAVLPFHSRVPRIGWHLDDGTSTDLWMPTRCPAPVLRALVAHALTAVAPTALRAKTSRGLLRAVGVRASDFRRKPTFGRSTQGSP